MENFIRMLEIQSVLFIYLLVGIYARKKNIINEVTRQSFVDFLLIIALPCMIFNSFRLKFTVEMVKLASLSLLLSFGVCLVSFLLGKVIYNRYPLGEKCIMQYGTLVSNAGFAGLPLVASAFGDEALFYASIFIIPNRIFMWSAGISLFTAASFKNGLKKVMLNPGIIAVELGLVRMIFNIPLHPVLDEAVRNIGGCTSALSMILVGAILADVDIKTVLQKNVFVLSFVRLLLLPCLLLGVLKLLGLSGAMAASAVMLTGMPVGATTAILAQKYDADYRFGSKCVFVSTILSLFTAPLLALLL
ncbi:AEC family transporter [Oscillospiraceae bacterium PP1C4]